MRNGRGWWMVAWGLLAPLAVQAEILAVEGFESGDLRAHNGEFSWTESNGSDRDCRPHVTAEVAHAGRHSLKFVFRGASSGEDAWSEQRFTLTRSLPEIYIQWFQLFPKGQEGLGPRWQHRNDVGDDNNKFLRLWADEYKNATAKAGMSLWPKESGDSVIIADYGRGGLVYPQPKLGEVLLNDSLRGKWVKFQARVKVDDGSGNGVVELWVNGEKKLSATGLSGYPEGGSGNYYRNGYFMGWANSGFDDTEYTYIDDVVVSTEFIRSSAPQAPKWIGVTGK